jgi:hypothetical protein
MFRGDGGGRYGAIRIARLRAGHYQGAAYATAPAQAVSDDTKLCLLAAAVAFVVWAAIVAGMIWQWRAVIQAE